MPKGDVKTIRIVISPDSENTSLTLWYHIWMKIGLTPGVKVKEKAYGLLIKGPKEAVDMITSAVRKIDPYRIFIAESAPPVKGHKIFRGFLQLSGEFRTLPLLSQVLQDPSLKDRREPKVEAKLVRCRYVGSGSIDALLINYGDGKVEVRCPEMMLYGYHLCGYKCPYGILRYP